MTVAPGPKARQAYPAKRRPHRSLGGIPHILASPQSLVRPLAHLVVLSLVLVGLPAPSQLTNGQDGWVEDVGSSEVAGPAGTSPIGVELGPMLELGPALPAEPPVKLDRAPLKLRTYVVKPGDTLSTIASRFELSSDTLVWANDVADPDLLLVGSKLMIPPAVGVLHRVRPGDTVAELASYYNSDLGRTFEVNGLEPPYVILVGQRLLLPDGKMPLPSPPAQNDVQAPRADAVLAARIELPRPAMKPLPSPIGASAEQARFILSVADAARQSQRETGVPASVSIAQSILESFWGSSRLSRENNNYFGIKAKERPGSAGVAWYDVWEVIGGANVIQREPFRAYNDMAESFVDHGLFFHQNWRYSSALVAREDAQQFAREINQAGYATDPSYAPKLIGLMDRFNLYQYDK